MFLVKHSEGKLVKIAVVGLGKIGLPLATQYASKGHTVIGVDVNPATVKNVNSSEEPFPGEFGLAEALRAYVPSGLLRATTSFEEAIPVADVVVVVVPLFVDEDDQPDFGGMDSATTSIGKNLTTGTLVIYETTLPIGTTRNRWKPMLEELSGLTEGSDLHLVFSPERVLTGRVFEDLKKYPKLIGGLSKGGTELAREFYDAVLDFDHRNDLGKPNGVWDLGSAEAAEMAKLAETTYRDVNIALANQFALHAEEIGVDVYKVIEACNSQPYSHIHRPGISVGGHCIPVYPRLYSSTDRRAEIVEVARRRNLSMLGAAAERMRKALGSLEGVNVLVLGVSYRAGVKETAFSGAFPLVKELEIRGASVSVIDPLYSAVELGKLGLEECPDSSWPQSIVLHTDHSEFKDLSQQDFPNVTQIYDGRGFLDQANWPSSSVMKIGVGAGQVI